MNYIFREQLKHKGLYAELSFECNFNPGENNKLEFKYLGENIWELPCKMGANIFYDYFKKSDNSTGRLEILINTVDWYPVDTNNLIVMYACVKGLLEAFKLELNGLKFDSETESFLFPEIRKTDLFVGD